MSRNLIRARWAAFGAAVAVALGGGTVIVANAAKVETTKFTAITACRILDTRATNADDDLIGDVKPLGSRKGVIGPTTANDITVIFDRLAKYDPSGFNSYKIPGMNTYRALMGDCDGKFGDASSDIPNDRTIVALLLNVTIVNASADGFITVYPWVSNPLQRPLISNLNTYSTPPARFNAVTVPLNQIDGSAGIIGFRCAGLESARDSDSTCNGLRAFRIFNRSGTTHIVVDLMGYYW